MNRRKFVSSTLGMATCAFASASLSEALAHNNGATSASGGKVAVIDVTDLYSPFQDPGDSVDLVHAYALPEIDLRAIILDITEPFRLPVGIHATLGKDANGPREPGTIPVFQLNSIFDRNVPCAVASYTPMLSLTDDLRSRPMHQQAGVDLILDTLRSSNTQVDIVSFGSCRAIAAALNRDHRLLQDKVRCIHVSAGTASSKFEFGASQEQNRIPGGEWNVALDPYAFRRLLTSNLNIAIYPCATVDGPFSYGVHNTYWCLPDLHFIRDLDRRIRNYLLFALGRQVRPDFLRALNGSLDGALAKDRIDAVHHVWETAVWLNVSSRKVVKRIGRWQVVPANEVQTSDHVLRNELQPCRLRVREDARIAFDLTDQKSNTSIFIRGDPMEYQSAMREAWPILWQTFQSTSDA